MSEINVTNLPADIALDCYEGDTLTHVITIKEDDVLVDLTGDTFAMRLLDNRGTTLHDLSLGSGITVNGTGIVQWKLTAAQVAALPVNCKLPFDFQWTRTALSVVKTLEKGYIKVVADITP